MCINRKLQIYNVIVTATLMQHHSSLQAVEVVLTERHHNLPNLHQNVWIHSHKYDRISDRQHQYKARANKIVKNSIIIPEPYFKKYTNKHNNNDSTVLRRYT